MINSDMKLFFNHPCLDTVIQATKHSFRKVLIVLLLVFKCQYDFKGSFLTSDRELASSRLSFARLFFFFLFKLFLQLPSVALGEWPRFVLAQKRPILLLLDHQTEKHSELSVNISIAVNGYSRWIHMKKIQ